MTPSNLSQKGSLDTHVQMCRSSKYSGLYGMSRRSPTGMVERVRTMASARLRGLVPSQARHNAAKMTRAVRGRRGMEDARFNGLLNGD